MSAALVTAMEIGPRGFDTRAISASTCWTVAPLTDSIGVASPTLAFSAMSLVWRAPATPMSWAMARISSICSAAASIEPAAMAACTMCTASTPWEWPSTAAGLAAAGS